MKHISFKTSDTNFDSLKNASKKTKISMSKIINFLIENNIHSIDKLQEYSNDENTTKIIKIRLTQKEFDKLKEFSKVNLHSSVTKEAKYHILNAIYSNKFLTQLELTSLALSRAEIQKIGVNINQFIKVSHTKNIYDNIPNSMQKDLQNLLNKIDNLKNIITLLIDKKNERMNKN